MNTVDMAGFFPDLCTQFSTWPMGSRPFSLFLKSIPMCHLWKETHVPLEIYTGLFFLLKTLLLLMWTIFKGCIEFVTIVLLFSLFCPGGS